MQILAGNKYAGDDMRNRSYDNFKITFQLQLQFPCKTGENLFQVEMRRKSPVLDKSVQDFNGIMNVHDLVRQYFLWVSGDGRWTLEKTEPPFGESFWVDIVNDDGRKIKTINENRTTKWFSDILGINGGNIEISFVYGHFILLVNGAKILDIIDEHYYNGGYICLTALNSNAYVENIKVTEICDDRLIIKNVTPTQLYLNGNPEKRLAKVAVDNNCGENVKGMFILSAAGIRENTIVQAPPGEVLFELPMPDVSAGASMDIEFWPEGAKKASAYVNVQIKPARKRILYTVTSAHEDLGYCGYIDRIKEEMARYLEYVEDIIQNNSTDEDRSRYRYVVEHLWWFFGYSESRGYINAKNYVDKYMKNGLVEQTFTHSGTHTYWNQFEQMIMSAYYASRQFPDLYNLKLETAIYSDIEGVAWPIASIFAKAGCKYLLNCRNMFRAEGYEGEGSDKKKQITYESADLSENNIDKFEMPFWWIAPNGTDRLLTQIPKGFGGQLYAVSYKNYNEFLDALVYYLDAWHEYPYDEMLNMAYMDHLIPNTTYLDIIERHSKKYAWPKIKMSTAKNYFKDIEDKYGNELPKYSGEISSNWGDFSTNDSKSFGLKRHISNSLPALGVLGIIARLKDSCGEYPYNTISDVLWRLMEFDEHCWPTMPPPTEDNVFNTEFINRGNVEYAGVQMKIEIERLMASIFGRKGNNYLILFNPYLCPSDSILKLDALDYGNCRLTMKDKDIPLQFCGNRLLAEIPVIAPLGDFCLKIDAARSLEKPRDIELSGAQTLVFNHYIVTINDNYITQIEDKDKNRLLIDDLAEHSFNQMLYVHTEAAYSPDIKTYPAENLYLGLSTGEVADILYQRGYEPQSGTKFECRYIFYKNSKRIDIENRIFEASKLLYEGAMGKSFNDLGNRYMDNFFFAFPFKSEQFEIKIELAGCTADYERDFLPVGNHDYVVCQNYIAIVEKDYSIALMSRDVPAAHLGKIRYNRFGTKEKIDKPHIYSYPASSRMSGIACRSIEECDINYDYTIYTGESTSNLPKLANLQRYEPIIYLAENRIENKTRFIDIKSNSTFATALKYNEQPGDGLILRFCEQAGKKDCVRFIPGFMELDKAYICSINETAVEPLAVDNNSITVNIGSFDIVTVALYGKNNLTEPQDFKAISVTDNSVSFSWHGNEPGYLLFMGQTEDFKPLQYNICGYSANNNYTVNGLCLDTDYFFKLAAYDQYNNMRIYKKTIHIHTSKYNSSQPAPLSELRLMALEQTVMVLAFKTSKEDDISFYEIYRAECSDLSDLIKIDTIKALPFYVQFYKDKNLKPDTLYYYKICPVDIAGNKNENGPIVRRKTQKSDWWLVRSYKDKFINMGGENA